MSETASAPPTAPLGALGRMLGLLSVAFAVVGGVGVMGLMAIINADVIGRGAFGLPFPATAEIVAASIVAIVFLQLPLATAEGRNIRSDMLLGRVRARSARLGDALDALHHLIGTLMLAVLLRYIVPEVIEIIEDAETVGLYGVLLLPRWPFVLCILAGCALTFLQYAALTAAFAARAARGEGDDGGDGPEAAR